MKSCQNRTVRKFNTFFLYQRTLSQRQKPFGIVRTHEDRGVTRCSYLSLQVLEPGIILYQGNNTSHCEGREQQIQLAHDHSLSSECYQLIPRQNNAWDRICFNFINKSVKGSLKIPSHGFQAWSRRILLSTRFDVSKWSQ